MIDKPLIANVVASATIIVVGTLCVFYAEVCRRLNSIEYLFENLDERWQSYTKRYNNDIYMFCLF
jgi:hypothetical protein